MTENHEAELVRWLQEQKEEASDRYQDGSEQALGAYHAYRNVLGYITEENDG